MDFNQLTETDEGIHYIMIDTGYQCRDGGEPIYGGFSSNKDSGDLDNSYDWSGIWIGTREMILKHIYGGAGPGRGPGDQDRRPVLFLVGKAVSGSGAGGDGEPGAGSGIGAAGLQPGV